MKISKSVHCKNHDIDDWNCFAFFGEVVVEKSYMNEKLTCVGK